MSVSSTVALRLPAWPQRIRLLRRAAAVISVLAIVVDTVALFAENGPSWLVVAPLGSLAGVVLVWRRPWSGLVLTVAGCLAGAALGSNPTGLWTVVIYTLFSAVLAGVPAVLAGGGVAVILYVMIALLAEGRFADPVAATAAVAAVAAAGVGGALRAQWRYWTVLEERAADAIAARQREVERGVVEERLRIARDLHDLMGHEVAVLNMQIGVAEVHLPSAAGRSRQALLDARAAVQSVLQETQQILAVLRNVDSTPTPGQPTPGAERIGELVDSFRQIGLQIDAHIDEGIAERVHSTTGLALYRILQEALTNAQRYGDGRASVRATVVGDTVHVSVDNDRGVTGSDHGADSDHGAGSGHGLIGIRERADSLGGQVDLTSDEHGFHVRASLPTRPEARR